MNITGGTPDVTTYFVLRLAATGVGATGLDVTTFDLQYVRTGVAPVAKVDATALAATDSAHADNKAIEIDATDQPGLYRVDWPDAAFAAGVKQVILTVKCATCFTEHMAVEIDTPVNAAQIGGTAQTGNDVGADVNDILVDTAVIGALGAGLTAIPWNSAWDAEVQSEADDALTANASVVAIKGKTDLIPADITTQLDTNVPAIKAKTDLLPADTATQLDTNIPAIKTQTDKLAFTVTNRVDANALQVGDKTGYALTVTPPTSAEIKTAIEAAGSHLALIKAKTDNLPSDPADESLLEAAIAAVTAPSVGDIDTQLSASHGSGSWEDRRHVPL